MTCLSGVLDQAAVDPRTISCLFISVRLSQAGRAIQPDLGSGTPLKESGCAQGLCVVGDRARPAFLLRITVN